MIISMESLHTMHKNKCNYNENEAFICVKKGAYP